MKNTDFLVYLETFIFRTITQMKAFAVPHMLYTMRNAQSLEIVTDDKNSDISG